MKRFTIYPLVALVCAVALYAHAFAQCGVERWSVKTGTDPDADLVNLGAPTSTTIAALRARTAPNPIPSNNRVSPTETTLWVINATLTKYKRESDSDYHLVLSDSAGNTMITEIPAPACVGAGSQFASGISHARAQFDAKFTATTSFKTTSTPVRVTGIGMFDFLHGQTGVAPNGIELHPVIDIIFNPTSSGDFTIAASGNVSVPQGGSQTAGISTSISGSFNSAVSLSISGLPSGASGSFAPASIPAPGSGSSMLTITAGASTPTGTYNLTITGTGGGTSHTTTIALTVTSGGGTVSQQLIGNPGFENGSSNPSPWTATSGVIDSSSSEAAHSGSWKAWLDGYGTTHTDTLRQSVTIPADATSATLSFWLHIDTDETTTTTAFDTLAVQVRNSGGTVLATLATYSNLNANTGFRQVSFNLLAYKGQSIQINLVGTEGSQIQTSFVVDDFALNITTPSALTTIASTDLATATAPAAEVGATESPATISNAATSSKQEEIFRDDDGGRVFLVRRGDGPIDQWHNHGGEVIAKPELHNIFLGSAWKDSDKAAAIQTLPASNGEQVRNFLGQAGVGDLSLPSSWQDQPMDFPENKVSDMQIRAGLDVILKQGGIRPKGDDIFVIHLPPGTLSTLGPLFGSKHYLGYHDHYFSESGRVNYVVIPFDSNSERRQETIRCAEVQAIVNPIGNGWY